MSNHGHRVTTVLNDEAYRMLVRIAQQEFRTRSSTIALLILREAEHRGLIGRAPLMVVEPVDGASKT